MITMNIMIAANTTIMITMLVCIISAATHSTSTSILVTIDTACTITNTIIMQWALHGLLKASTMVSHCCPPRASPGAIMQLPPGPGIEGRHAQLRSSS